MSVINKMLQDLESRRPKTGDAVLSAQIRAVPVRRGRHPAWLAASGALLVAAVAWIAWPDPGLAPEFVTAAPTEARAPPAAPTLPASATAEQGAAPAPLVVAPLPVAPSVPSATAPVRPFADVMPPASNPVTAAADTAPAPASAAVGLASPPAAEAPVSTARARAEAEEPAQIQPKKEITAQQRTENEYAKAVTLVQEGRSAEAMALLGTVLQLEPKNNAARQTLVGLLVEAKRYPEAQRLLRDGLQLDPRQTGFAMILARLQVEQGDDQGALASLQGSSEFAGGRADYQAFLAALLQRAGRHKEAIVRYLQALRGQPDSGLWLMGLGISLKAENRRDEAREAFARALASNSLPSELQAYVQQQMR